MSDLTKLLQGLAVKIHLSETQRGIVAGKIETMKQGDNQYGHANLHDHQITRVANLQLSPVTQSQEEEIDQVRMILISIMQICIIEILLNHKPPRC